MTTPRLGLTQIEVKTALKTYGFNEFESQKFKTAFTNLLKILRDPMGLMLLVLSGVYWLLGERNDAIVLMVAYLPIVGIDVFLDLRSQTALRSLARTLKSTCTVIRDGQLTSIPIRNLVPGDALVLEEGQTVPADGRLLETSHLTIDESSMTGESVPIDKLIGTQALSGTTVVSGTGVVQIEKTGLSSQIGSIAKVLMQYETVQSPLLRTIRKIVGSVSLAALGIGAVVFFVDVFKGRGFGPSLISSLTLAMAAIPEEFPLVFTLYLSLAAFRLSRKGVLVKSLPAVEVLGRVDIICTDKTGTLTEGKFKVEKIIDRKGLNIPPDLLVEPLVFACELKPVDAMEAAIFEFVRGQNLTSSLEQVHQEWELEFDYPFSPQEKYMSHVWKSAKDGRQRIAMKGAIESVLEHCVLDAGEEASIMQLAHAEASSGRRLLGLASKVGSFTGVRLSDEVELTFLGLISFTDPVRPSAREALRFCAEDDISIKILTGDYLPTAKAVADEVRLTYNANELFNGPEIEKLPISVRQSAFEKGVVFARLQPQQKLELVTALKSAGHVVAMMGDGINDAPALKIADIGISMGDRATDVARSTAQIILLKNDFGGIGESVREGRRVMNSLGESFGYLIAFHIPIISLGLFQSFFMVTPLLLPIHIVLMQLIVHPVSAFVFDEASAEGSKRRKHFITKTAAAGSAVRGLLLTVIVLGFFYLAPQSEASRRSFTLLLLIAGNIGLLFAEVGGVAKALRHPLIFRRAWLAALILTVLCSALSFSITLVKIFNLVVQDVQQMLIALAVGAALGLLAAKTAK